MGVGGQAQEGPSYEHLPIAQFEPARQPKAPVKQAVMGPPARPAG
jgi:hypothetical protein